VPQPSRWTKLFQGLEPWILGCNKVPEGHEILWALGAMSGHKSNERDDMNIILSCFHAESKYQHIILNIYIYIYTYVYIVITEIISSDRFYFL